MSKRVVILLARLLLVLVAAGLAGVVITLAAALIGHEVLVARYGENLAPIDDTPPMQLAVATAYAAGALAALAVLVIGWRGLARR